MKIRCGTCAWADHQGFYPAGLKPQGRLAYYARFFSVVEVDSSFYGIPQPKHVQDWVESTPQDFIFDLKVYRSLTLHNRTDSPETIAADARKLEDAVGVLRTSGKLGALLFQFPPWFVRSAPHVDYVKRVRDWFAQDVIAVEFRHRSWWQDEDTSVSTAAFLTDCAYVNVVCDEPQTGMGTIPFAPMVTNPQAVVFRLHGRNAETWYQKGLTSSQQRFDYKYAQAELRDLVPYVRRWEESAQSVHVLMNNNQADYAVANAFDWLSLLSLETRPRPQGPGQQMGLFE